MKEVLPRAAPTGTGPVLARTVATRSALLNTFAVGAVYVVAYVILDVASYIHPVAPYAITPWNPPPGLSLALLLAFGVRYAPALFVAALLAELLVRGGGAGVAEIALYALILAGGYTAIAGILVKVMRFDPRFASMRDLLVFTVTVAAGTLAISALYVGAHVVSGRFSLSDFADHALHFWVGDIIGVVVTTPFLLIHARRRGVLRRMTAEALLQGLAIVLVLATVFSMEHVAAAKFFYLLFLPLIWICVRHGFPGATAGLLATQIGLIVSVHLAGYATQSVVEFQLLMLALAITGAFLGMAVTQWRRASQALEAREADLNRAMRVAAAAEMASALAHELNQPLTAASNYVQACDIMLGEIAQTPPALSGTMRKALNEVERAGEVVRRLRDFYRGGEAHREPVELSRLVEESMRPLRARLERHRISVTQRLAPELPPVAVDRVQIELVIHNLLGNAIDAISDARSEAREILIEGTREGASVALVVHDSGPGVAPAIAEQLFQTFATSKPTGMGLGLAISRSIVESHGGRLWLQPAASGARFVLHLPIT